MKILGSDYDGTMYVNKKYEVGLNDVISECRKKHLFGIVTGRSLVTLEEQVEINNIPVDFLISNNGGIIKVGNEIIQKVEFNKESIQQFLSYCNQINILGYVLNSGLKRCKVVLVEDARISDYGDASKYIEVEKFLENEVIAQTVLVLDSQKDGESIAAEINRIFINQLSAFVNVGCIDVVPYGVNKANGLSMVASFFKIDQSNIYCIGDGGNDLPMLLKYNGATLHHASDNIHDVVECSYQDVQTFLKEVCNE